MNPELLAKLKAIADGDNTLALTLTEEEQRVTAQYFQQLQEVIDRVYAISSDEDYGIDIQISVNDIVESHTTQQERTSDLRAKYRFSAGDKVHLHKAVKCYIHQIASMVEIPAEVLFEVTNDPTNDDTLRVRAIDAGAGTRLDLVSYGEISGERYDFDWADLKVVTTRFDSYGRVMGQENAYISDHNDDAQKQFEAIVAAREAFAKTQFAEPLKRIDMAAVGNTIMNTQLWSHRPVYDIGVIEMMGLSDAEPVDDDDER